MDFRLRNLKLSTKVLLMMGVPFIVNAFLVLSIYKLLLESNALTVKEEAQIELMSLSNHMWLNYYEYQGKAMDLLFQPSERARERCTQGMKAFMEDINKFMVTPNLSEPQKRIATNMAKSMTDELETIDNSHVDFQGNEFTYVDLMRERKKFIKIFRGIVGHRFELENFYTPQRQELDRLHSVLHANQEQVTAFVIATLVANLLVIAIVQNLFGRYVSNRVQVIVDHARELATNRKTETRLSGRDEFAVIDESLQKSAANLDRAFEHRRALMQMIAHDLRSPLTASQVLMEILLEDNEGTKSESRIEQLISNSKRMLSLIKDLLLLDALESNKLPLEIKTHSLEKCVNESTEILSGMIAAKSLKLTCDTANLNGSFDINRVQQVLTNLLSNAIKFSKERTEIKVLCKESTFQKILVQVVDQGPGIDKSDQESLFQQFFQTKDGKAQLGSGLGLAISKLIIEAHGETIGCDSTPGRGATFWFTLPYAGNSDPEI